MRPRTLGFCLAASLLAAMAAREAIVAPIWSPRDEIAHFDFIDQLASLRYPAPSDSITDHTARLCRDEFEWYQPKRYDGSKTSMDVAGWSYESQNPPLYYGLLAPLHRMVKGSGAGGTTQIFALRIAGVLLYVFGSLLLVPIFVELERCFGIPRAYGVWLALIALTTNHRYVASLGNDVLSIPLSSTTFYFSLRYWRSAATVDLAVLAAAACAASVAKLTNVFLLLVPLLAVIAVFIRSPGGKVGASAWAIPPLALLPLLLYLARNVVASGRLLGPRDAIDVFATFVEPVRPLAAFLGAMVADSFNLQSFQIGLRSETKLALTALLFLGSIQSLIWLTTGKRRPEAALHLVAVVCTLATMTAAVVLNEKIRGVHWHVFRHYYAVFPLWMFAFLVLPLRLLSDVSRSAPTELNRLRSYR